MNYYFRSEDQTLNWSLGLRKDSCIIDHFSFSKKNKKEKLIEKIEMREDLIAKKIIDDPNIANFETDTDYRGTKTPIGVLDTGIDYNNPFIQKQLLPNPNSSKIPFLGLDMVDPGTLPYDFYADDFSISMRSIDFRIQHQHGTHVAGIATKNEEDESSREYRKALEKVISENTDMVFVVAAGNESADLNEKPQYPANFLFKNVITVASIDKSGELSNFSNYNNSFVDIAARGSDILSQWPYGPPIELSGTSMATPQVTRVCGRIQHKKPEWSAKQIVDHILKTAKIDSQLTEFVSMGRVLDENQALQNLD